MAAQNLGEFLDQLESAGELVRIREPLRVELEITEVADRVMKSPGGGPALLVERPVLRDGSESDIPVGINLFGSWRRMAMALGVEDVSEHADRLAELLQPDIPKGFWAKVQAIPKFAGLARVPPRPYKGRPPCQEIVREGDDVDLARLPILTSWPDDAGPFVTFPMVITRDPETEVQNVGMYRMQVTGPRTTFMHWQRHKGGAAHFRKYREMGIERMPVAVAIGADPATMYTPTAPLPPGIDEYLFSGFLRREPLHFAEAVGSDLRIPAEAEIVLEGYVDMTEPLGREGPFGDHTGFYTPEDDFPYFHVERVTMRRNAVYAATIVGRPPMEDFYLGGATERIFLPLLRLTMPEVLDYHMPAEGIFHNLVFVSIRKEYPGHAYKVMNGLWGQGLMSLAKVIVVVDHEVDVHNPQDVWWYALNNIDPERDVRFTKGPIDDLDHSARGPAFGTKMGIDGTRKWPEEGHTRSVAGGRAHGRGRATSHRRPVAEAGDRVSTGTGAVREGQVREGQVREGQTFAGGSLVSRFASFVKLPHTLFALPFAGVGAIFGASARPGALGLARAFWIVVAFTAARFSAMGFNRLVDRHFDAANPRTARRELPSGRLTVGQAVAAVVVACAVFVAAAWRLNPLCGWLSLPALAWVFFYSYTKRFTAAAHWVLGFALSISPVGAYLAVTGEWSTPWYALLLLSAAVVCWVAGFDVIYSLQDEAFDRKTGLHSVPARIGARKALTVARAVHFACILLFAAIWATGSFGVHWLYGAAVLVMAVVLHFGHQLASHAGSGPLDIGRIDRAFFATNAGVSMAFFVLVLLDRVLLA